MTMQLMIYAYAQLLECIVKEREAPPIVALEVDRLNELEAEGDARVW